MSHSVITIKKAAPVTVKVIKPDEVKITRVVFT